MKTVFYVGLMLTTVNSLIISAYLTKTFIKKQKTYTVNNFPNPLFRAAVFFITYTVITTITQGSNQAIRVNELTLYSVALR